MIIGAETSDRFLPVGPQVTGGMGAVVRALDRRTGELVALKRLQVASPELAHRLAAEAEALAVLEHPAVVRLVAHGTTPQKEPFLAMEWLEGEDLEARLDRGHLAPREAAILGLRVAEGIAAAHARGILHRDIKPSNLFLVGGRVGSVKVLDFGIARIHGRRRITPAGQALGTPGYVAPEQAAGARDLDARADVFSLGAVLFECLTGRPPFVGEYILAALAKILLEDLPRVADVRPSVPRALADLVDGMLAKDRAARPPSAAAVVEALSHVLAALRPEDEQAPASERVSRPPEALTDREQRLVTVLAVQPAPRGGGSDIPAPDEEAVVTGEQEGVPPEITARLREAVAPFGGRTDHMIGGWTLVTWSGAEGPLEQAARAARCALIVRGIAPDATIAVASGLGDALEPRPTGQALDRAAALLAGAGATGRGRILVDNVAGRLLDSRFRIARGPSGAELVEEGDFGDETRTLLGRPTPCVGRARELRVLRDLFDECVSEGAARAVLVTGPVGTGKSRLRQELLRTLSPPPPRGGVWLARGDCMSAGSAFATVASALRNTALVRVGEPRSAAEQKLAARVAEHAVPGEGDRIAAFLGEVAGVPFPEGRCPLLGPARRSPEMMADQIRRAWCDFVAAECRAHPVLLVIEDLHWGDTPSVDLIDAALDRLSDRPFFVLALSRPEVGSRFPELWAGRGVQEIRLQGLSRTSAEQLVRHVLGASVDDALVAQIVARASGNAFYLEELIRAAAEGDRGALPETVLAVVQARLDALAPEERRVLRAASVLGEALWPGAVASLLGDGDRVVEVRSHLDGLVARELVVRRDTSRFPAEQELAFRHALVRDGAYTGLTESDRGLAHGLAAAWLERAGEGDPVVLAGHFDRSGRPERAIRYHLAIAARALMGNDLQGAIAHAGRPLPEGADDELRRERAWILTEASWFLGDLERADEHAGEALRLAPIGSSAWCTAISFRLMLALEIGSEDRIMESVTTFMGAEVSPADAAHPYTMLVLVFSLAGQRELATYFLDCCERAAATSDPMTRWFLYTSRGLVGFFFDGDFWAARGALASALACAEEAGQRRYHAISHALLGWCWAALGAVEPAEHHLRQALERSSPRGLGGQIAGAVLVLVLVQRGATGEAVVAAKAAIDAAKGNLLVGASAWAALSYAHLLRGELEDASRAAGEALAGMASTPHLRSSALAQMAAVRLAQGRAQEALRAAREGLGSEEPCRAHPFVEMMLRSVEVQALTELGDAEDARAALARARARLQAQARRIGDEAVRRRFLERVRENTRPLGAALDLPGDRSQELVDQR